MSVEEYLLAKAAQLSPNSSELVGIERVVAKIKEKLYEWDHIVGVKDIRIYGSYARKTRLPISVDRNSDVDLMVIFRYDYKTPKESFYDILKSFAVANFRDEIVKDEPSIVILLDNIKIEMTPAIEMGASINLQIPTVGDQYMDWTYTDPFQLVAMSNEQNRRMNGLYLPMVRLIKYWNILNGKPFESYKLENYLSTWIFVDCNTLFDCLIYAVKNLHPNYCENPLPVVNLQEKIKLAEHFVKYGQGFKANALIDVLFP